MVHRSPRNHSGPKARTNSGIHVSIADTVVVPTRSADQQIATGERMNRNKQNCSAAQAQASGGGNEKASGRIASAVVAPIRSAKQLVATGGSDMVENKEDVEMVDADRNIASDVVAPIRSAR